MQDISEGIKLLNNHQKLVRMADASDLGWRIVQEYVSNPLASDEEDEKRMNRAEARANRKAKQERQKKLDKVQKSRRFTPYPQGPVSSAKAAAGAPIQTVSSTSRRPGLCFECGLPNHWKFECPSRKSGNKEKKSIFPFRCNTQSGSSSTTGDLYVNSQVNDSEMHASQSSGQFIYTGKLSSFISTESVNSTCNIQGDSLIHTATVMSPVGRLRSSADHWIKASANRYVLSIVQEGYRIPFKNCQSLFI